MILNTVIPVCQEILAEAAVELLKRGAKRKAAHLKAAPGSEELLPQMPDAALAAVSFPPLPSQILPNDQLMQKID